MVTLLLTDSDEFAGTECHMLDLAQGLRQEGAAVRIASPGVSPLTERAEAAGFSHTAIEKQGLVDWAAIHALRRLLTAGEIDIVHAHNGRTALSAALAVHLARRGACVASQHFLEPGHLSYRGAKAAIYRNAHQWVDTHIDHYIAVSDSVFKAMQAHSSVPADRITVITSGMRQPDPAKLTPPAQVRAALGITADTPLIVCVARLEREKDVRSLVTAMARVKRDHPDAVCAIAGDGSLEKTLAQQICESGLQETVRLLGFRSDALSLINACDLYVLCSLKESFGLVLLEAMSLARPVVATCCGGPSEIVSNGETGLLVPPGEPEALAMAIENLLRSPALAAKMGLNGQRRFTTKFTSKRMAQDTLTVYNQAIAKRQTGVPGNGSA
jgi:glycosyltransferase involved in cell wall biosynthesis